MSDIFLSTIFLSTDFHVSKRQRIFFEDNLRLCRTQRFGGGISIDEQISRAARPRKVSMAPSSNTVGAPAPGFAQGF
jgi:hypothetical protein